MSVRSRIQNRCSEFGALKKQIRMASRVSLVACIAAVSGCGAFYPPLSTVEKVDIDRYTGRWFEIARYPNSFETGCVGVTADYALRDDGRVSVTNTCVEGDLDGEVRTIEGVARVTDSATNAKLAVSFFFPFESDYWILELGDDYEYAVVGEPSRTFLWILSRESTLDESILEGIKSRLPDLQYDPERLEMVPQNTDQ
ncbi:MAG TPA: lipocalin family protein [Phycisphaerae bacterium]|nr:lipocalin family protein [Phycisphaerae bacterium]